MPYGQRGERLARHGDALGERRVKPDQQHQHEVGDEHDIEAPWGPESSDAGEREQTGDQEGTGSPQNPRRAAEHVPQPNERGDDGAGQEQGLQIHAVGASVRSRIAFSA